MKFYLWRTLATSWQSPEFLDSDIFNYPKIKSSDLTLHTTVKIGGEDYEVMFMDIDED